MAKPDATFAVFAERVLKHLRFPEMVTFATRFADIYY
jgi:hypothetical protein